MENLIDIINRLQNIMTKASINSKIKLPQMVIVGSQSSGKSSLIEAIVGKEFLPRGTGIVTRRPLILQLKNTSSDKFNSKKELNNQEWGEFSHLENQKFTNFSDIRSEIQKDTSKIAGNNKGISSNPIILKICSPNVVDLSLVDLPGLVNVPVGDQPKNIDEQVRSLIIEFIKNPNSIILAVSPASNDIANSEALKLAREVDPTYNRTLGIISKIDLMDKGTDCLDVLKNKTFPLKFGYIGVVLRSQYDINNNKTLSEGIKSEKTFFENHPVYSINYKNHNCRLGIPFLISKLQDVLVEHIRDFLPSIREDISNNIFEKQTELDNLGGENSMFDKEELVNAFVLNLVNKFSQSYNEMIEGSFVKDCNKYFIGGSRINYIYQEIFKKDISRIDPFDYLSDDDIRTAIKNSNGLKPSLFIPEQAFEVLVKQQISRLSYPSLFCVKQVHEELKKIVDHISISEISRFNKLESRFKQVMVNVLDKLLEPTNKMIKNLIDIEKSYINTTHPDFLGPEQSVLNLFDDRNYIENDYTDINQINNNQNNLVMNNSDNANSKINDATYNNNSNKNQNNSIKNFPISSSNTNNEKLNNINIKSNFSQLKKINQKLEDNLIEENKDNSDNYSNYPSHMRPGIPSTREVMETCIIKNLISSYYNVVKKNISDLVPKTIMCFLVNESKRMAETEMINQLYKSSELDILLQEDPIIANKRKQTKEALLNLKESMEVLCEIKELKI